MANRTVRLLFAALLLAAIPLAALAQVTPYFPPPGITYGKTTGTVFGTATGGAQGVGTINAQGLYINGAAVSTTTGTVTTTGSPVSGNLTKFSGASSITNGDLSGDCTTSGALTIACTKTGGVAFAPIATSGSASDLSAGTTVVARGGTGLGTLTAHGVLLGEGTSNVAAVSAMAADTLLQGQGTSSDPAAVSLTNCGDSTHALAYSTSSHAFSCQSISGSGGSVTTTGSPASGNLAKFSGSSSVTNGDLSGDCTTSATLAITCTKTNGSAFVASATTDTTSASNISAGSLGLSEGGLGGSTSPTNGQVPVSNSGGTAYVATSLHKLIGFSFNGVQPSASYVFLYVVPPTAITVPSGAGTSTCGVKTAVTASTTLTVTKNGSSVGTCVIASGTSGAWTWSSGTTWNGTSDTLEIDGPASPDATAANFFVILNTTTTAP